MFKSRFLAATAVLVGVVGYSSASDSFFTSSTNFNFVVGNDVSVSVDQNQGGPYVNFAPTLDGDGVNDRNFTNRFIDGNGNVYAQCGSSTTVAGDASQFQGMNYFLIFTNNSTSDTEGFSVQEFYDQFVSSLGIATTNSYGGFQEYGESNAFGYFQLTSVNGGPASVSGTFAGSASMVDANEYTGFGGFSDVLAPGESISVQIWASGSTEAHDGRVLTPEPVTMTLGIAGIGAFLRRRRKNK